MQKRFVALLMIFALFFSACGLKNGKNEETASNDRALYWETKLYYPTNEGYIVPVSKKISWSDEMALEAVRSIIEGNVILDGTGLLPALKKDTDISLAIEDGRAYIDIGINNSVIADETALKTGIEAVAKTLIEFPGIDGVSVSINGSRVFNSLDLSEVYEDENINVIDGKEDGENVKLCYQNEDGMLVPVLKSIDKKDYNTILNELKNAPYGLKAVMPQDAEITAVSTEDGILYFDMTGSFDGFDVEEEKILNVLAYSFDTEGIFGISVISNGRMLGNAVKYIKDCDIANALPEYAVCGDSYSY